jgi:hypothetical protein
MSIEDGSLGTRRARQLRTVGGELSKGGLMSEDLLEQALEAVADWARGYREDLGNGVKRRIEVTAIEDDHIDVEVQMTGYRDFEHRYRLTLQVQEIQ